MRILVVDDDSSARQLVELILRSGGHQITTATDGVQALEIARHEPPELVISDILMPHMDGYQLCRLWKDDERLSQIPLAFYTASYVDPADERFASGLGADAFWRKPMEAGELLAAVDALIGSPAQVRQPEYEDEAVVLQEYNARLVEKLEDKARNLEIANAELRETQEALAREVTVKTQLLEELAADVLVRQQAESDLRRERDFTRGVLEVADMFICILDAARRVTLFSTGAERITGMSAESVLGADAMDVLIPEGARSNLVSELASPSPGRVLRQELDVLTAAGDVRTIECAVMWGTDEDGQPAGWNIFGVDVTERRRLERLREEFVQIVSHELRTPLTSIAGFAQLLGQLPPDRLEEQAPVIVERLQENTDRMRVLVEELLEVNDIAARGVSLSPRAIDLGDTVERAAQSVFRGHGHPLQIEIAPDMPRVLCDAESIGRVVTNLVDNAVKYSPEGGAIVVRVATEGDEAVIAVADEGIGISEGDRPSIFEPFRQADMSSTREFEGIGLGLYIVREIVSAHGGRIDVASEPGAGSTFTVRLPLGHP